MTFNRTLLERMPPRALDLRPRLARAVDSVCALRDPNCANAFVQIALRADTWISQRFGCRLSRLHSHPEETDP